MEIKKNPLLIMENNRFPRFLIGLLVSLSILFISFEWTNSDKKVTAPERKSIIWEDEELVPITTMDDIKPKVLPPAPPKVIEEINFGVNPTKYNTCIKSYLSNNNTSYTMIYSVKVNYNNT